MFTETSSTVYIIAAWNEIKDQKSGGSILITIHFLFVYTNDI